MAVRLATGPVSWGVDFADAPDNPPWHEVLDEIAECDVDALELGPIGYLPTDPEILGGELASRGLTAVGSFVFDDFHDPAQRERVLVATEQAARVIATAGGSVIVLIDRPSAARVLTSGRSSEAPRLDDAARQAFHAALGAAAAIGERHGLRAAVHPHAGSYLEFEDELERLVDETDLGLCLDTGHLVFAGADPVALIERHAERLVHLHLKDVAAAVLADVVAQRLDFWVAIDRGVFCPLGEGAVDVAGVLGALDRAGYEGFATLEQDRVPGRGSPVDDVNAGVRVVRRHQASTRGGHRG